jgi:hypothetical protein
MNHEAIEQISDTARRYRLRRHRLLTHEQRIDAIAALQNQAMQTLKSNSESLAWFHRRNHRLRRESNVRRLEMIMKRQPVLADDE